MKAGFEWRMGYLNLGGFFCHHSSSSWHTENTQTQLRGSSWRSLFSFLLFSFLSAPVGGTHQGTEHWWNRRNLPGTAAGLRFLFSISYTGLGGTKIIFRQPRNQQNYWFVIGLFGNLFTDWLKNKFVHDIYFYFNILYIDINLFLHF